MGLHRVLIITYLRCYISFRYRPWPQVAEFLTSLIPGSVVLDVGCGNGKYSQCNKNVVWIGTDRSVNLTRCCVNARATPSKQSGRVSV